MNLRFFRGLAVGLTLLLPLACVDLATGSSGGTAGVALYAFDATTSTVLAWNDLGALYDASATPAASRTFTGSLLSKVTNLSWGGLCLDSTWARLYLVSDTGDIVRIEHIRSQTGTVPSTDITSFKLSATGRLSNSKFGQAAIDPGTDTLYITENGDNGTQIWVVPSASLQAQDASVALQALVTSGDTGGTGVAASAGTTYGFMVDGNQVGIELLTGPRLRKGTASAFTSSAVILGGSTGLGKYGSLALDTSGYYLFSARHNVDSSGTAAPIQVFRTGQFGVAYNQAPAYTVGTAADQPDLRVIAHAGNKDWLVGLRGQGTVGYPTLFLWKSPLGGTAAKVKTVDPAATVLRGVALDGNAS